MSKSFLLFMLLLVSLSLTGSLNAVILNVPEDFETIQAAIDEAQRDDIVLVQEGVYEENLTIPGGRNITLASLTFEDEDPAHIEETIIDGGEQGSVITLTNGNDRNSFTLIAGVTIRNGLAENGGGMYIGGNQRVLLSDMLITQNQAEGNGGGIIGWAYHELTMTNVRIIENTAGGTFGGMNTSVTRLNMTDCQISRNTGRTIASLAAGRVELHRVEITDNIIQNGGYAVSFADLPSQSIADHLTVAGNVSEGDDPCQGLSLSGGNALLALTNSIIYGHAGNAIDITAQTTLTVSFCDIEGGEDAVEILDDRATLNWQDGNINADPLFVDGDNGDYHLTADSPCIDAGDPDADLDPDGTRSDMGAYFHQRNQPPEIIAEIMDFVIEEDQPRQFLAELVEVFSDPDGFDELSFGFEGEELLGLEIDEENILSMESALNFFGDSLEVYVYAHDMEDSVSVSFYVTVTPVNDPPTEFDLLFPEDNYYPRHHESVRFSWQESIDPDGDADVNYWLIIEQLWGWGHEGNYSVESQRWNCNQLNHKTLSDSTDDVPWPFFGDWVPWCYWYVQAISGEDTTTSNDSLTLDLPVSVTKAEDVVREFRLYPAYPNPFNSTTTISFNLPAQSYTNIGMYNTCGQLVEVLQDRVMSAGKHSVVWNAGKIPTGVYILRGQAGRKVFKDKLVLVR